MSFSAFTYVRQTCFAYNLFFSAFKKNFFNGFENSMKFCVFRYLCDLFKKMFNVILVFFQTWKPNAQKTAPKIKKRIK
jgi:hypothetical protein